MAIYERVRRREPFAIDIKDMTHGSTEEDECENGEHERRGEPRRDTQDKEEGDPDGDGNEEQHEHDDARTGLMMQVITTPGYDTCGIGQRHDD